MNLAAVEGPGPLLPEDVRLLEADLGAGADFRAAWEALLLRLSDARAEAAMLAFREARSGWWPLVQPGPGSALVVGNACAGTAVGLAAVGFEVTLLDPAPHRLRFAAARLAAAGRGARLVAAGDGERLPFADRCFDLVVQEGGVPGRETGWGHDVAELLRVARGEVLLVADNRLGYKRSRGRRGQFAVPSPLAWIREALRPTRGERTLAGYRELLEHAGYARPRALALYPHADDFTHVVALDELHPRLYLGPLERRNHLKVAAEAVGLFPVLTPSFALLAPRREHAHRRRRIERILEALAERLGERVPQAEELVATRGNTLLVQTRLLGAPDDEPTGRWTLHVPLSAAKRAQCERHVELLRELPRRFPGLALPELRLADEIEGLWLACEGRLVGHSAAQLGGGRPARRMLEETAGELARLVVERRRIDAAGFEELVGRRFDLVATRVVSPAARAELERLREQARTQLTGRELPLVRVHGDVRAKHVQVRSDGSFLGLLDWGISEDSGLPAFDLAHLVVHQRKQEHASSAGAAWRAVRDPATRAPHEAQVLRDYATAVDLAPDLLETLLRIYPVLVADIAERSWDYSRPRWLERQFELGAQSPG